MQHFPGNLQMHFKFEACEDPKNKRVSPSINSTVKHLQSCMHTEQRLSWVCVCVCLCVLSLMYMQV